MYQIRTSLSLFVQVPETGNAGNANVGNLIDLGDDTTTTTTQVADQMANMSMINILF